MSLLKKVWRSRWILRSLFHTIWFNFHYLPIRQAIKLPILLNKPNLLKCEGVIQIEGEIKSGMIRLGQTMASIYADSGFIYENHGGTIIFKGTCIIGHSSAISIGDKSVVIFGDDFMSNASTKLVSFIGIEFGKKTRMGWNNLVMDTNFHPLYDIEKKKFKKAYGKIVIGNYNWIANQCVVMHSVTTPERCIFGLRSVITRGCKFESFAVHGGSPLKVLSRGAMRDYENDQIKEYN